MENIEEKRKKAIAWWNKLNIHDKNVYTMRLKHLNEGVDLCDGTNIDIENAVSNITGREIQEMWEIDLKDYRDFILPRIVNKITEKVQSIDDLVELYEYYKLF
jgi:hypothetical protein